MNEYLFYRIVQLAIEYHKMWIYYVIFWELLTENIIDDGGNDDDDDEPSDFLLV